MPGQCGALDPGRVLAHPVEHFQFTQIKILIEPLSITGCKGTERLEISFRVFGATPAQRLGHDRGRSGRDRTPFALESDFFDDGVVVHVQVHLQLVAAQRIETLGSTVGVL